MFTLSQTDERLQGEPDGARELRGGRQGDGRQAEAGGRRHQHQVRGEHSSIQNLLTIQALIYRKE